MNCTRLERARHRHATDLALAKKHGERWDYHAEEAKRTRGVVWAYHRLMAFYHSEVGVQRHGDALMLEGMYRELS